MATSTTTKAAVASSNGHAPRFELMTITPQMASEMLASNNHNRRVDKKRIFILSGAMARGEWRPSNDAIVFDEDGNLQNGQHRLHAVVASGVTIVVPVIRDMPAAAQEAMDIGAKRSIGDMLTLRGYSQGPQLASVGRLVLTYHTYETLIRPKVDFTAHQILTFIETHPGLSEAVKFGRRMNMHVGGPRSWYSALYYLASEVDQDDANAFFDHVATGVGAAVDDPVYQLREKLLAEAMATRKATPVILAAWTIKAFNLWRDGERVGQLRWRRGGAARESFPAFNDHPAAGRE